MMTVSNCSTCFLNARIEPAVSGWGDGRVKTIRVHIKHQANTQLFDTKTFACPEEMSCFKCRMSQKCTHVQVAEHKFTLQSQAALESILNYVPCSMLTVLYLYLFIVMCNCVYLLTIPVNTSSGRYFYPSTNTYSTAYVLLKNREISFFVRNLEKTACKVINIREA